jgi:predicted metal-dependent HD superfamily phosphohydrolase
MLLKDTFTSLIQPYCTDAEVAEQYWLEIEKAYTGKKRHYHNLTHLEQLWQQLLPLKTEIKDWDTLLFSLFYHDVVYNVRRQDNEEKSAELAKQRLQALPYPPEGIDKCVAQILATKSHTLSPDSDTNLFTDADLAILGQDWSTYHLYTQQVRREYSIYPDLLYKPGRKKVLQHFLNMERIFKTTHFYTLYEQNARNNLNREIAEL